MHGASTFTNPDNYWGKRAEGPGAIIKQYLKWDECQVNQVWLVFIPFDPNFKHNKYTIPDFSPEKARPQNAGSTRDEFVSRDKKFVEKSDANLAL